MNYFLNGICLIFMISETRATCRRECLNSMQKACNRICNSACDRIDLRDDSVRKDVTSDRIRRDLPYRPNRIIFGHNYNIVLPKRPHMLRDSNIDVSNSNVVLPERSHRLHDSGIPETPINLSVRPTDSKIRSVRNANEVVLPQRPGRIRVFNGERYFGLLLDKLPDSSEKLDHVDDRRRNNFDLPLRRVGVFRDQPNFSKKSEHDETDVSTEMLCTRDCSDECFSQMNTVCRKLCSKY